MLPLSILRLSSLGLALLLLGGSTALSGVSTKEEVKAVRSVQESAQIVEKAPLIHHKRHGQGFIPVISHNSPPLPLPPAPAQNFFGALEVEESEDEPVYTDHEFIRLAQTSLKSPSLSLSRLAKSLHTLGHSSRNNALDRLASTRSRIRQQGSQPTKGIDLGIGGISVSVSMGTGKAKELRDEEEVRELSVGGVFLLEQVAVMNSGGGKEVVGEVELPRDVVDWIGDYAIDIKTAKPTPHPNSRLSSPSNKLEHKTITTNPSTHLQKIIKSGTAAHKSRAASGRRRRIGLNRGGLRRWGW